MKADQIIEEMRHLSQEDMVRVVDFVDKFRSSIEGKTVRHIDPEVFDRTADKVFREHAPMFEKLAQ